MDVPARSLHGTGLLLVALAVADRSRRRAAGSEVPGKHPGSEAVGSRGLSLPDQKGAGSPA